MKINQQIPPQGTFRDWLDHRAEKDEIAFIFPDEASEITWPELRQKARSVALYLMAEGAQKSESVALLQPNCKEAIIALFGVFYGGFRATLINLVAGEEAVRYALNHCEARFAFAHEMAQDLFNAASNDTIKNIRLDDVLSADVKQADSVNFYPLAASDHALLMYTSGTTGVPKGVLHSHASLLAGGWTCAIAHELNEKDRGLCVLPIYHINGLCVTVIGALVSGGLLALCAKFSARKFWHHAKAVQATWGSVVPTIIGHLLHGEETPDKATVENFRFMRSASAPLSPDVQSAFEKRFEVPIVETMGLTETAAQILSNPLPPGVRKIGSPGIEFGNEVAIVDPKGAPLARNQEGEIVIRGANVMLGYFKNEKATKDSFFNDWLRTGDLAKMDDEGYIFVTGRLKELIIKGGENIAPREIDDVLYSHPHVIEAAAFAVPCDRYGETVEAAVKLTKGTTLGSSALQELCMQKLGSFKKPDCIHVLEELPKGPSGKIQRNKILNLVKS